MDGSLKPRGREAEARHYWTIMQEGWSIYREHGPHHPELQEIREEIEAVVICTEWPLLRQTCDKTLKIDDRLRLSVINGSSAVA